jgi:hypothetical protein
LGVRADAGDEHQASDAGRRSDARYRFGAVHVHGLECRVAALDIGRNGVHHGVDSGDGAGDGGQVAHVGAVDHDPLLAGRAQHAARRGRMADRDADSQSVPARRCTS